jgi:hypothetical protein
VSYAIKHRNLLVRSDVEEAIRALKRGRFALLSRQREVPLSLRSRALVDLRIAQKHLSRLKSLARGKGGK